MGKTATILTPVLDDWKSVRVLIRDLDTRFEGRDLDIDVLLVDDGSFEDWREELDGIPLSRIRNLEVLRLTRNMGHQRAIALGISYLAKEKSTDWVVVMDADGEDRPSDVPRLLDRAEASDHGEIVFAERIRRAEGLVFRVFYLIYKLIHFLLVGRGVRVGNFSVIPGERLASLTTVSELWNHYAAAVYSSRQPTTTVGCERAQRIDGKSKMGFVGLVVHGLSAISVHAQLVCVRLMIFSSLLLGLTLAIIGVAAAGDAFDSGVGSPWLLPILTILAFVLVQGLLFSFGLAFLFLGNRITGGFLPCRDFEWFVKRRDYVRISRD